MPSELFSKKLLTLFPKDLDADYDKREYQAD
jgi:hypothetical protein